MKLMLVGDLDGAALQEFAGDVGAVIIANSAEPEAAQRELRGIGHLLGEHVGVVSLAGAAHELERTRAAFDVVTSENQARIEENGRLRKQAADDGMRFVEAADRWRRIERLFWRVYLTPTDTRSYSVRKSAVKLRDEQTTPGHRPRMTRVVVRRKAKL